MLGPALKKLFFDLHHRTTPPLSKFEQALHRELLGILLTKQFEMSVSGGGPDALVRTEGVEVTPNVQVSSDYLKSIPGGIGEIFSGGPNLNFQVDLSGGDWGDSSGMQIGCGEKKCKYREPEA
jgi:hypothetical protein